MLCYVMPSSDRITRPTTHTHPFNGPFSGTTWVSRYQKGKTNLDFTEARDSEWPWHQLGHMQVCTSFQADNHASTPPLCFLQAGCPSCRPTNSVKALKAKHGQQHSYKMAAALSWSCEDDSSTDITTGKSDLLFRAGRRCQVSRYITDGYGTTRWCPAATEKYLCTPGESITRFTDLDDQSSPIAHIHTDWSPVPQ